jgi:hypothetical protein
MGIINWLTKPFTIVFLAQERSRRGGTSRFRKSAGNLLDAMLSLSLSVSYHTLLMTILCRLVQRETRRGFDPLSVSILSGDTQFFTRWHVLLLAAALYNRLSSIADVVLGKAYGFG